MMPPFSELFERIYKYMNIQQAKEQVKNAITAYRTLDQYGRPAIPQQRQRPVFLVGAPGIGKTAIMEQIAQELGIPLVSYSMTHHTRQSALGLPFIQEKTFEGQSFRVSEYTMSEIIAAVYERMEQTGLKEGILFLDEINCVSETLAPSMLQFLQYKVFGQHKVPEGWIVVTAGNPPEYNNSVREFDIVTWDRLKRIDVEPDYTAWRAWAVNNDVHPAVLSYLDIRKDEFYRIESTVDGKSFVTPRGWVDLSDMIRLYEQHSIPVDDMLTRQYLQNAKIARQFASYYDLWKKYRSDYAVQDILAGKVSSAILQRAQDAKFDERISLVGLLMDGQVSNLRPVMQQRSVLERAMKELQNIRKQSVARRTSIVKMLQQSINTITSKLSKDRASGMLSRQEEKTVYELIDFLQKEFEAVEHESDNTAAFTRLKADFDAQTKALKKASTVISKQLDNLFKFMDDAFGEGQEMLILVTELTASVEAARFIAQYGCAAYFKHNKDLLFYERQVAVIREIDRLSADSLE